MKKKIVSIILCLCMMLPFSLAVHAQEPLNYLLFGDSIAQRFGVFNSLKSHYNTGMFANIYIGMVRQKE